MKRLALLFVAAALAAGSAAAATTVRIATAFDPQTMDPHAIALLYHTRVVHQIYEALVSRDEQFRLEPALATSWQALDPKTWRFKIRQGVTFHDGTPLTADDVVFSMRRVVQPTAERAFQLKGVAAVKKIDAQTVEFQLELPDAVLPEKLTYVSIMSKAWCEAHKVELPQDFKGKQETFAVRNANGTGPYQLERYEPDVRTLLKRNPRWWGWADKRSVGNADEVVWLTVRSDATRIAALISGEAELVLDPPIPDVARLKSEPTLTVAQLVSMGTQYLTLDQWHDELEGSDVKGRNPFKDLRVRKAVYQAINVDLIAQKVMRGLALPTGALLSPLVIGSPPDLERRLPYDPAGARALLAEAGYPNGFSVTLECVNVAWREAVCQAMAAMLTQAGIRATFRSMPTNQFFPKLSLGTISLAEFGWTATPEPWPSLNGLLRSFDKTGSGTFNAGRYNNPRLDALIDAVRVEADPERRKALVGSALRLATEQLALIPLYRPTLSWAMKKTVHVVQWPSDALELRWLRVTPTTGPP